MDPQRREEFMRIMRARGSVSGFESQVYRKNGDIIWISENARAVFDDDGQLHATTKARSRTSPSASSTRRASSSRRTTTRSPGLPTARCCRTGCEQAILAAASYGTRLAVVFVDLDRFKFINDSLGHHVGDELLKTMAERLESCVRECDTVARLGGDEFVLLINGQTRAGRSARTSWSACCR